MVYSGVGGVVAGAWVGIGIVRRGSGRIVKEAGVEDGLLPLQRLLFGIVLLGALCMNNWLV